MRIVCWNLARAFRPKGRDQDPWEVLDALRPDIALLQESSAMPDGFHGEYHFNRTRHHWGTAVWSRYPLRCFDDLPGIDRQELQTVLPAVDGYFAGALVEVPAVGEVAAVSVHAYPSQVGEQHLADLDASELVVPHKRPCGRATSCGG